MSKSPQKWSFKITNSQNFISFLKKLKLVDKSVPLEIEGERLFAKVKTSDKSVIKFVEIDLPEVMEGDLPAERIKIGILEIGKLIDVFKYFGPEEDLHVHVETQLYDGDHIATSLKFSLFHSISLSYVLIFHCLGISTIRSRWAFTVPTVQSSILIWTKNVFKNFPL